MDVALVVNDEQIFAICDLASKNYLSFATTVLGSFQHQPGKHTYRCFALTNNNNDNNLLSSLGVFVTGFDSIVPTNITKNTE